ncbi:restriction endonuclease subunit S [Staphylococcus chromogenes]
MVPRQDLDLEIKYDKKNLSNYKRTLPNDFIISLRSFQGGFELNTIEGIVSPAYTVLRGEEKLVQPKFFKQYFKSIRFIKKLDSMIYGIRDGKSISYKEFSTFSINYPSILEQQKIGNFFSKLDRQIELEEEKLELLEQQKKGYMQKIFSQELRLKDKSGNNYPKWNNKKLKDIIHLQNGYAFKSNLFSDNGIPIIRITDINKSLVSVGTAYYPEDINIDERFKINKNDILIAMSGATTGKVGKYISKTPSYLNQRIGKFVMKNGSDNNFIFAYLNSINFKKELNKLLVAGAQPNISSQDIENISLTIPSSEEQERIGTFYLHFNNFIEKQSSKVGLLKQRKQGLLQKMFV